SEQAYIQAAQTANILFGNATQEDIQALSEQDLLTVFANVPQVTLSKDTWGTIEDALTLVTTATEGIIFKSKGEARRMIQGGGVSINKVKVTDPHQKPDFKLLQEKYMLVQQGKKNYHLIVIE
ncbi:MAG: S4 domain-containing protein, partial [Bacteroidota bacterium]